MVELKEIKTNNELDYSTIFLCRRFNFLYPFTKFDIYIDDKKYDTIGLGQNKELKLPIGTHTIHLGIWEKQN